MKYDPISRRHFLRGAGGFLLSLPALPALLSPKLAEAACLAVPRRLVTVELKFGVLADHLFFPAHSRMNLQQGQLYPGHQYRYAALPQDISPCFGSGFNAHRNSLTFVRGVDVLVGGHNPANTFGNIRDGDGIPKCPTVEQVVADHYQSSAPTPVRSLVYGNDGAHSWRRNSSGEVVPVAPIYSAREAFDLLFGTSGGGSQSLVVDRVLEDYNSTRQNQRLDHEGREKLDQVMDTLRDLQNRLNLTASCNSSPTQPPYINTWQNYENQRLDWQNMADVLAAAFLCCQTNVAAFNLSRYMHVGGSDWHDASHLPMSLSVQNEQILPIIQSQMENFLLPLLNRLDAILEPNGRSALYNTLIVVGTELTASNDDHSNLSNTIVMAGRAGGRIQSGYFDYRNFQTQYMMGSTPNGEANRLGIPLPWHLMTILQACGLSPEDARSQLPQHTAFHTAGYGAVYPPPGQEWTPGPDQFNHSFYSRRTLMDNYYLPMLVRQNTLLPHATA